METSETSVSATAQQANGVPTPAPRRGRPRWVVPALATGVAVVAVIAVLWAGGYLAPHAKQATPIFPTFLEASGAASPVAGGLAGGPCNAEAAAAYRSDVGFKVRPSALTNETFANCSIEFNTGLAGSIGVNSTPVGTPGGAAAFWLIVFGNSSGELAAVTVTGGAATLLFQTSGHCSVSSNASLLPYPSDSFDSPAIISAANASGGAAFLAANPNASQVWFGAGGLVTGLVATEPLWGLVDTTCPLIPGSVVNGSVFTAAIQGEGVATVLRHNTTTVNCLSTGAGGFSLVVGSALAVAVGKSI